MKNFISVVRYSIDTKFEAIWKNPVVVFLPLLYWSIIIAITKTRDMKLLHLLSLLFFFFLINQQLNAQVCQPNPSLTTENSPSGLYPSPFHPQDNPSGGITEIAYNNKEYEFVFTLVLGDTLSVPQGTFIVDELRLLESGGLPNGLEIVSSPGDGRIGPNSVACLVVRGTPDDVAGIYDITFEARFFTGSSNFLITFPDDTNLPGQRYLLTLEDGCPTDPCDGFNVTSGMNQAESCANTCDGVAQGIVTGGTAPFDYNWRGTGAVGTNGPTATDLCPGIYRLTVTDDNGCEDNIVLQVQSGTGGFTLNASSVDADCSGGNGSATATPSGGNSPFNYEWSNGDMTASINNVMSGTYTVTVEDASGCTMVETVTVGSSSGISASVTSTSDVSCNGGSDGSANIDATGTGLTYTWSGSAASNTMASASNLSAGDYTVTIMDGGDCSSTVNFTITEPTLLSLNVTKVDADCTPGSATASPSGGTMPYRYNWSNGETTATISNLSGDTYSVTITDANDCVQTESVVVNEPAMSLSLSTNVTSNVSCNDGNDGSASVTATGGSSGYTYVWSGGAGATASINGVSAGNYTVTVTDGNNCTQTASVTITEPSAIGLSTSAVNVSCSGDSNGSISVSASGGAGDFTYNWSNGLGMTSSVSNLSIGTYTVTVTDADGCTRMASETITAPNLISLNVSSNDMGCDGSLGTATATATGGNGGFSYMWSDGQTSATATNLASGTYQVTVTDSNNCSEVESVTIGGGGPALQANITTSTNVSCDGAADGSATVSAMGGSGTYTYQWSNGATTNSTITGLSGGSYSVTVSDNTGCMVTENIFINEPAAINITPNTTDVSCNGETDGTISLSVSGGSGAFSYNWNNGLPAMPSHSGLSAGSYEVTVTDGDGCSDSMTINIIEPTAIQAEATTSDVVCAGQSTGVASIDVNGGTSPYTYQWSISRASAQASNLSAGMYTVTVSDANNCQDVVSFTISQPIALVANVSSMDEVTIDDGSVAANPSGGMSPYTYRWNYNNADTRTLNNLPPGTYTVTVTDANDCTAVESVTVNTSGCAGLVEVSIDVTPISCAGASDGVATVNATGGAMPYNYDWSGNGTTESIDNLDAGTYTVTVTDANDCPAIANVMLTNPTALDANIVEQIDASCAGEADGVLEVMATGGTAPFSYNWEDAVMNARRENLAGGNYDLTITDSNNCSTSITLIVNEPNALAIGITGQTNVSCAGMMDGSAQAVAAGGTPPYTYAWSNGGTTQLQSNLNAGIQSVSVTDSRGCMTSEMLEIEAATSFTFSIDTQSDVSCNGGNDGSVQFATIGGSGGFTYNWSNNLMSDNANNLEAGTYTITATDNSGCSETLPLVIEQPDALSLSTSATDQSAVGATDGSVSVSVSGGMGTYTYAWDTPNNDTTELVNGLAPGTYTVIVTDGNGCTSSASVTVGGDTCALSASATGTNILCNGDATGMASVQVQGASGNETYVWSNEATTASISQLVANTYTVTISEGANCNTIASVIITEPSALQATIVDEGDIACGGSDNGFVQVEAGGGAGAYTYLWSDGQTTERIENLAEGDYNVTITDANNCTAEAFSEVTATEGLNISATTRNVSCFGAADGSITIQPNGGMSPYEYTWSGDQSGETINNLSPGEYAITVSDINDCSATLSITISEPADLLTEITSSVTALCGSTSTASASVVASGGMSPYEYLWSNGGVEDNTTGLGIGMHNVTITDANQCTSVASVNIELADALMLTISSSNASNINANDGSAVVGVEGGTMPFEYLWTNTTGEEISTSATLDNIPPGEYTVLVTDANDCSNTEVVLIEEEGCSGFSLELQVIQPSCDGTSQGSITAVLNNATGNISYNWSNEATTSSINNLEEGTYTVMVTDANDCSSTASATIAISTGIDVNIVSTLPMSCQNIANGSATLEVIGGVAPYTFLWPVPGDSTNQRTNLVGGFYNVSVSDAAGCSDIIGFTVDRVQDSESPNVLTRNAIVYLDEFGNATLETDAVDNGTTDNCSIEAMNLSQTEFSCDDLENPVSVTLMAEDKAGNTAFQTAQITILDSIPPILICPNDIRLSQCDAVNSVEYPQPNAFDNCGETIIPTLVQGMPSGTNFDIGETEQIFSAMDGSGNMATCRFLVIVEVFDVANVNTIEPSCFNFQNGGIEVEVEGAMEPLTYLWSNGSTEASLINIAAGEYSVTITDGNACEYQETITLENPPLLSVSVDVFTERIDQNGTGLINISAMGGRPPYNYRWMLDGQFLTEEEDLSNAVAGVYRVQLTDSNGCSNFSQEIRIALTTSTDEWLAKADIDLMPNPTSGLLQLKIDLPQTYAYHAQLYDLTGRKLQTLTEHKAQSAQHEFDLSTYESGVYFLRIQIADSVLTKRVLLMKP